MMSPGSMKLLGMR